jgi:SOS-response transcriptional repressor LexA
MTPRQQEVYIIIEEWWDMYGYGPSIDDIMFHTKSKSRSNIHRICNKLVDLGHCKKLAKSARSIRPKNLRVREIE